MEKLRKISFLLFIYLLIHLFSNVLSLIILLTVFRNVSNSLALESLAFISDTIQYPFLSSGRTYMRKSIRLIVCHSFAWLLFSVLGVLPQPPSSAVLPVNRSMRPIDGLQNHSNWSARPICKHNLYGNPSSEGRRGVREKCAAARYCINKHLFSLF